MTPAGLDAFRLRMKWKRIELARALEIDRKTCARYLDGLTPVPRSIALACAALAHGLPPMA